MNDKELIDYLFENNPHWNNGVSLTAKGLIKLIETAHQEGVKSGKKSVQSDELFTSLFGGLRK